MSAIEGEVVIDECALDTEQIDVGQTVLVTATVTNTSSAYDAEFTVGTEVEGDVSDSIQDTLGPTQSREYEFTEEFDQAGSFEVEVVIANQQFIVELYSSYEATNAETNEDGIVLRMNDSVSGIDATLN